MLKYSREILDLLGKDLRKLPSLILLFLGSSLLDLAGIGLIGPYIALVMNSGALDGTMGKMVDIAGLPREQESLLILLGLGLVVIFLTKAVLAIWINRTIIFFSLSQLVRLRSFLMQAYQYMPYTEYLNRNSSEYIYSIQSLTTQFAQIVLSSLRTISNALVALVILALLAWQNAPALVLLVGLLGTMVMGYDRLFRLDMGIYGQKSNVASTSMVRGIHEGIEGLKEIRILGKERFFHQVVHSSAEDYSYFQTRSQVIKDAPRYLLEFLLIAFVVLLVVGTLFLEQSLQSLLPTLGMFGVAALRLVPSANSFSGILMQLRYGRDGVSRLHRDFVMFEQVEVNAFAKICVSTHDSFRNLMLGRISFRYPKASRDALYHISLEICAGESIGLIGPSGSGKTTLVDLLLGLLEPQEGEFSYNGQSMNVSLDEWRSQVAYLPQQVFLIDNTLRCNVALGLNPDEIDDLKLHKALQQARLTELVDQLPQGVDTHLGERGVRLSGGQRQRVALARAFYHGRSVLIMDEATSALDYETEHEVVKEIKQLKGKKTMVVIAHRLTTLQHCDRIYELKDGQIINTGSYQEMVTNRINVA